MTITLIANSDDVTTTYGAETFALLPFGVRDLGTGGTYALGFNGGGSITVFGELYGEIGSLVVGGTAPFTAIIGDTGVVGSLDRNNVNSSGIRSTLENLVVNNAGHIFGYNGIDAGTASGFDLVNTGLISGINNGVTYGSGTVNNQGTITSNTQSGVSLTNGLVENSGSIRGGDDGVSSTGALRLVNTGLIQGELNGVFAFSNDDSSFLNFGTIIGSDDASGFGVRMVSAQTNINHGTISGFGGVDIAAFTGAMRLFNHGTIIGQGGEAIDADNDIGDLFVNTGDVHGYVDMEGGDDTLRNSGLIDGDVLLGAGNDLFKDRDGTVTGEVIGGTGDDTYIVNDARIVLVEDASGGTDTVRARTDWTLDESFEVLDLLGSRDLDGVGNTAANTINGNGGDNRLYGLNDDDTIDGGAGNDYIQGGGGHDVLFGVADDDTIAGGAGHDTIDGGIGDDLLRGGNGNDILNGGFDNDTLIGGDGRDSLTGGGGFDLFVFRAASESPNTNQNDTITDFEKGFDLIDLSRVPGTLTFVGSSGFSGTASEVRVTANNGTSIVRADLDGNGSTDMRIRVLDVTGLDAADFLL